MKSIERRFINTAQKNPHWSSCVCFAQAVKSQNFSKQSISRWFNKLVDKNDYERKDKRSILSQLNQLSNTPEDNQK